MERKQLTESSESDPDLGEPIGLIYGSPDERIQHLDRLIRRHLTNGGRCVCVLQESADPQVIGDLTTSIPDSTGTAERDALVFSDLVGFVGLSAPTAASLIDAVRRQANDAQKHGFPALLLVLDMELLESPDRSAEEIRSFLSTSCATTTLVCLYNGSRSNEDLLRVALESHPRLLVDSRIVPNPYCIAVRDRDARPRSVTTVDQMLAHIRELCRSDGGGTDGSEQVEDESGPGLDLNEVPIFFQSVADALVRVNADGTILEMNTIAETLWDRDRQESLGRNIWDMFPEAVGGHTYQQIQRTIREKRIAQFETHSVILKCWVEVTLIPNADELWISVRDISRRKQIEETLNARVRQQAAVAELGKQALESTDIQAFMNNLVNTISQTLDVEFVSVLELLQDRSAHRLVAGVGWEPALIQTATVDGGTQSQAGYTLQAGGPIIVQDLRDETRFSGSPLLLEHGITSGVTVLISGIDGPFGVLGAHSKTLTRFTQDDVNFMQSVANILSTAIDQEKAADLQRHYAAIVSSSDEAIIGETLEGLITGWNASAERIFGYSAPEVIGQPVTMLYPAEQQHEMQALLEDIRQGRKVEQHESVRVTKDGRLIDVSVSLSPIRDRAGRIVGASKFLRDVSERKQAELERLAINHRLQLALESGRMGTWDWNLGTDDVIWSGNMERIHGLAPGTFGGTFEAFKQSIHPDDRDRVLNAVHQTLRDGEDYHIEYRNIRPDGSSQWLEARGRIVPGGFGRPEHLTGVCTDVTEQVEFRQQIARFAAAAVAERDRLQQVIDVIPEGIAIADVAGRIIMSNEAAREIWGQPPPDSDLHGHDVFGAQHPDGTLIAPADLPTSRSVLHGERIVGEQISIRNADSGDMVPLLVNSAPIRDEEGEISGAVTTFQDFTMFKEFERQKDEFLQTLSHDLKNPLTSVKGNAQFLRRRTKASGAELMPIIDRIEQSAVQAVELIDELLDLTRLQMGRPVDLVRGRTDLIDLVNQLAEQQAATSRFHFIRVEANNDHLIGELDKLRVTRVLSNLLNNAIKYSPDNSEIVLRVERSADKPSWAEIHVQDHGIGIPAADLPRLFERFRRGSNVEGQIRGSGLGLASAKQIVDQHGGWIDVESVEGEGSTFIVYLPLEDFAARTTNG